MAVREQKTVKELNIELNLLSELFQQLKFMMEAIQNDVTIKLKELEDKILKDNITDRKKQLHLN